MQQLWMPWANMQGIHKYKLAQASTNENYIYT